MLAWLSPELMRVRDWAMPSGRVSQIDSPLTHDNISSTLLGLYEVDTMLYQPMLDLFTEKSMNNRHFDVASDRSAELNGRQSTDIIVSQ